MAKPEKSKKLLKTYNNGSKAEFLTYDKRKAVIIKNVTDFNAITGKDETGDLVLDATSYDDETAIILVTEFDKNRAKLGKQ